MTTCRKCGSFHDASYGSGIFCSRGCANSRQHSETTKEKISASLHNNVPWNKELRYSQNGKGNHIITSSVSCPVCSSQFICKTKTQIYCSVKCYQSDKTYKYRTKSTKSGGYRIGAGHGKNGWYAGYWCDSSWELAWVIYNLDHGVKFTRNHKKFEYEYCGKVRRYVPDFVLDDGMYVEIKGWTWLPELESKISQFPLKLKVLYKDDLNPIFEYVVRTYGKDFIKLYQGNPHNDKKNSCIVCQAPCKKKCCSKRCAGVAVRNWQNKNKRVGQAATCL